MYDNLFRILMSDRAYENEYVMRAVMRFSSSLHEAVLPYLNQLMDKLVSILRRSSRVSKQGIFKFVFILSENSINVTSVDEYR